MTEDSIDIVRATLKETWKEACKEVLGKTERNHKMWLSTATWTPIKERKQMKQMVNRCKTVEEKQEHQAKYNCHEIGIIWCTRRESPTPSAAVPWLPPALVLSQHGQLPWPLSWLPPALLTSQHGQLPWPLSWLPPAMLTSQHGQLP